jgi:hypothetical protein
LGHRRTRLRASRSREVGVVHPDQVVPRSVGEVDDRALRRWTPDAARKRARQLVVDLDQNTDPRQQEREARAQGTTLREAVGWHQDSMRAKGCAQRSIDDVHEETERHLGN